VRLDGGDLDISWSGDGSVLMAGPVAQSFEGTFDTVLIGG
jgi:diaminopimelate epimerase